MRLNNNFFKLVIAIAISEATGIVGAFFTTPAVQSSWYATLAKPALNPPAWVFAPVWTTLFALMGVSAWLVWRELDSGSEAGMTGKKKRVRIALGIFLGQLALNTLWSIIFFGLHSPGGALIEIVFLWLAILATIIAFYKISPPSHKATEGHSPPSSSIWTKEGHGKLAAWLLLPYILWISFAIYLNYAIWILN